MSVTESGVSAPQEVSQDPFIPEEYGIIDPLHLIAAKHRLYYIDQIIRRDEPLTEEEVRNMSKDGKNSAIRKKPALSQTTKENLTSLPYRRLLTALKFVDMSSEEAFLEAQTRMAIYVSLLPGETAKKNIGVRSTVWYGTTALKPQTALRGIDEVPLEELRKKEPDFSSDSLRALFPIDLHMRDPHILSIALKSLGEVRITSISRLASVSPESLVKVTKPERGFYKLRYGYAPTAAQFIGEAMKPYADVVNKFRNP